MVAALCLAGCDHATKLWAEQRLSDGGDIAVLPPLLELSYVRNFDVAFQLLESLAEPRRAVLIVVVSLLAIGACALALWRGATRAERLGYTLVLAGALGNLGDRLLRGYVVDFIHLTHWPVFNVADVWIVIGVAVLLLSRLRAPREAAGPSG